MADSDAILDLCNGFAASTSNEGAAVTATLVSLCTNSGFDASACGDAAALVGIDTCADLLAAGSAACSGMASQAVDAFEQAANTGHVDAQCRASGNPVRH